MKHAAVILVLSAVASLASACSGGHSDAEPVPADQPADAGQPGQPPEPGQPRGADRPAAPDTITHDGLRLAAATAVLESFPVQLHTTVGIVNTASSTITVEFPSGCVVLLRAFRSATDTVPAWDQGRITMCTMALQIITLQPRERVTYVTRTDALEILGDSLPDGEWHLRAYLTLNGNRIEIPAGTATLAVPRR